MDPWQRFRPGRPTIAEAARPFEPVPLLLATGEALAADFVSRLFYPDHYVAYYTPAFDPPQPPPLPLPRPGARSWRRGVWARG